MEPQRLTESELIGNPGSFQVFRTSLKEPYPLHWHEFYELTYIISGLGSHIVNGESHTLEPGVLFLLTPVDFHQLAPAHGQILEIFNIIFSGDFLDDELRQWLFGDQCYRHIQIPGPAADRVLEEYRQIWDEHQNPQLGQRRLIRGTLERILLELARRSSVESAQPIAGITHPAIQTSLLHLGHEFRTGVTLKHVAAEAGLTPNYFSELFHQQTGKRFQNYLQMLRLRFAAALLLASDLPITEICYASGFGNLAHFERAFREMFARSPSAYRHNAGGASGTQMP
ncbi:MAG TPA: AraC family transcriptional regulator [Anaerolineales bacterium]|nr:AraC family transcriptional regulator [Anaerolineales bacterium]